MNNRRALPQQRLAQGHLFIRIRQPSLAGVTVVAFDLKRHGVPMGLERERQNHRHLRHPLSRGATSRHSAVAEPDCILSDPPGKVNGPCKVARLAGVGSRSAGLVYYAVPDGFAGSFSASARLFYAQFLGVFLCGRRPLGSKSPVISRRKIPEIRRKWRLRILFER